MPDSFQHKCARKDNYAGMLLQEVLVLLDLAQRCMTFFNPDKSAAALIAQKNAIFDIFWYLVNGEAAVK